MPDSLTPPPQPAADLYVRAYRAGLPWPTVLDEAQVHRATWKRIERRGTYQSTTLDRIGEALDRLLGASPDPAVAPATATENAQHGA